jgi:hypothetical protein
MADASTLPAPLEAVRRLAARREQPAPEDASFPELVWAHFLRQREVFETGKLNGEAEAEYRRRLAAFEARHGRLINAYWCTSEASAVALTSRRGGRIARACRRQPETRFHAATDWVVRDSPEVANILHTCETLAMRAGEVLRGPTERIAMQWILAVAGHLLGFLDAKDRSRSRSETARLVRRKRNELEQIEGYYHRAGEKVGRLVYFTGMLLGLGAVAVVGLAAGGLLWWWTGLDPDDATMHNLAASYSMGAVGALMSVMTRMASSKEGTFNVDFEVGRGPLRSLGSVRPFIGAISALVVFFALQGDIVEPLPKHEGSAVYLFAVLGFVAGFSERWANVIFGRAERMLTGAEGAKKAPDDAQPTPTTSTQRSRRA